MNFRIVFRKLGILTVLVGLCMSVSLFWAFSKGTGGVPAPRVYWGLLCSVGISCALGGWFLWLGRPSKLAQAVMYRREAIAVVGLGWLVSGLVGALPFLLCGAMEPVYQGLFDQISAAVFESFSGFSTTGASIFPEPELLPRAVLFWRSLTHWLGGMGIVVLFVAILGETGAGTKHMVVSEVTGPTEEPLAPRIRSTALLLWKIYLGLSVAHVVCLLVQGMDFFAALCHTFGTMATGGFSTLNGSIGQYNHLGYEITIIVFMVLAGVSFTLYANLLTGRWRDVARNRELHIYGLIIAGAVVLLTADLLLNRPGTYTVGKALRETSFQTVSIITTTGYGTADFDAWPSFSRWLLFLLMFVGGCAGSTGGGIKVIRIVLFFKIIFLEVERVFRPRVVRSLEIGGRVLDEKVRRSVTAYLGIALVIFLLSTLVLLVLQNESCVKEDQAINLETAFTSVAATLNNIGPGLNAVGPTQNYAFYSGAAKLFLSFLMVLGRLEIMVVLCLFVPSFWRRD